MNRSPLLTLLLLIATAPALAQSASFHFVPDVPTDVGGSTFLPWEVVFHDAGGGTYASTLVLPGDPPVAALHRMQSGDWLLAVEVPTDLGGATYGPRDVARFDGAVYSSFFDGAANGVPDGSAIDALLLDGGDGGDLVVSFDVTTSIAGADYGPNDLVRFASGAFSSFFDGDAAGIPQGSNVVGADLDGADVVLALDVPTDLGGTTILPGELVTWDGVTFTRTHSDAAWPPGSVLGGFALQQAAGGGPGTVPATLLVAKVAPGVINLSWQVSCAPGATDYGIYEGQIGNWYSHAQIDCTDDGADLSEDVTTAAGDRYYLVVPHDGAGNEGSYGTDSAAAERPAGAAVCQAVQLTGACP